MKKVCVYTLRQVISLFQQWRVVKAAVCVIVVAAVCLNNEEIKKRQKKPQRNAQNGQSNGYCKLKKIQFIQII